MPIFNPQIQYTIRHHYTDGGYRYIIFDSLSNTSDTLAHSESSENSIFTFETITYNTYYIKHSTGKYIGYVNDPELNYADTTGWRLHALVDDNDKNP